MGKVVNLRYWRETIKYCQRFGRYILEETNPSRVMEECDFIRRSLSKDKILEGNVKRGIRGIIKYLETEANRRYEEELGLIPCI